MRVKPIDLFVFTLFGKNFSSMEAAIGEDVNKGQAYRLTLGTTNRSEQVNQVVEISGVKRLLRRTKTIVLNRSAYTE